MFASAYVQNGAKVYIASRKEKQLREVSSGTIELSESVLTVLCVSRFLKR